MLTTIKGIYEDGIIKPLEQVDINEKAEVMIIFLDTTKEKKTTFFSAAGAWKEVDTETLKKQIYKNRRISTRKKVEL